MRDENSCSTKNLKDIRNLKYARTDYFTVIDTIIYIYVYIQAYE